jgi:hypothetical protein
MASTTTDGPPPSPMCCATMRAIASAGPPGGNGRISRIGRLSCAKAREPKAPAHAKAASAAAKQMRVFHCIRLLPKAPMQMKSPAQLTPVRGGREWAAMTQSRSWFGRQGSAPTGSNAARRAPCRYRRIYRLAMPWNWVYGQLSPIMRVFRQASVAERGLCSRL